MKPTDIVRITKIELTIWIKPCSQMNTSELVSSSSVGAYNVWHSFVKNDESENAPWRYFATLSQNYSSKQ